MLRYLLFFIMIIHGMIHLMGFAKAFGYANIAQLTKAISRPVGALWFVVAILLIAAAIVLLIKKDMWWMIAFAAVLISQSLIILSWQDAKFGTVINVLILLTIIAAYGSWNFENKFKRDVTAALLHSNAVKPVLLTEADIVLLPPLVQRYIRYTGALNKPRLNNMQLIFDGQMRSKGKNWFPFVSEQYNCFDEPTRLFFMKATMFGITVPGYHSYQQAAATMQVKLFGLIPVINNKGSEMNKAETVTLFNDWCIFAPAALVDKRIQWQAADDHSVKATFTNHSISISATLFFNDTGQLVNFVSDDRYDTSEKNQYRFSTPVGEYKDINGLMVPTYGETIWHYPEAKFTYGKFYLRSITYNRQ